VAVATDLEAVVAGTVARLYVSALRGLPADVQEAIEAARERETSTSGRRVLDTIARNVDAAAERDSLVCQDTGLAVYLCRVGEDFPLHPAAIEQALRHGTERATLESSLRSNTVHTLTREPTGANVGHRIPIVSWQFVRESDALEITCVPKGSGSESMSFLRMCTPADGVRGIKAFVLESVVGAGGKPCPPGIVGVGIGGSADYAMRLAKEAIARPLGSRNPDPAVARLEEELLELLNETGVGPMGLGGDVTALAVNVEHADTHITLNPVAVNYQCWAARRGSARIAADGVVEYGRES
jgi:tartrate/fumarate subfamily iron-sulfur-dependent hydro-lyase alpha chain